MADDKYSVSSPGSTVLQVSLWKRLVEDIHDFFIVSEEDMQHIREDYQNTPLNNMRIVFVHKNVFLPLNWRARTLMHYYVSCFIPHW